MSEPPNMTAPRPTGNRQGRGDGKALRKQDSNALAAEINAEHEAAFGKAREAIEHARRAGELLLEAKAAVGHGKWLPWLKANCHFGERTAQGYMRLASQWDRLQAKSATVADLGLRDALALLAEPEEVNPKSASDSAPAMPKKGEPFEAMMAWADWQVRAPFNTFDLEEWVCCRDKLHAQIGLKENVWFCLTQHTAETPMVRTLPVEDIERAVASLAAVIHRTFKPDVSPDLTLQQLSALSAILQLIAQRDCGLLIKEATEHQMRVSSEAEYEEWLSHRQRIFERFDSHCEKQLAELGAAA
jgi:Protein of unknown function (DUF3102)